MARVAKTGGPINIRCRDNDSYWCIKRCAAGCFFSGMGLWQTDTPEDFKVKTIYGEEIIADYEVPNSNGDRLITTLDARYIVSRDWTKINKIEDLKAQREPAPSEPQPTGGRFDALDI